MPIECSRVKYDAYQKHPVFELINRMMKYYDGIWNTCFSFIPHGTLAIGNYAADIYLSIRNTLESISMLLKVGHMSDAFVLIRKLFDTILMEIYLNVVREDKYDWTKDLVVKDVDEWLSRKHRIPNTKKILDTLRKSKTTKDLYPYFGWDSYLQKNRELLDNHVHSNSYHNILLNCPEMVLNDREKQLNNASIVLNQIMMVHLAFIFFMNGDYMMSSDYMDYIEMGMTPPEGSQYWLTRYAQEAFDEFLKPHEKLASFVKEHCCMEID